MVVMKFGGTSVQNAESMDQALDIVMQQIDRNPVLISSAMAKITDKLIELGQVAQQGNLKRSNQILQKILVKHQETGKQFLTKNNLSDALEEIEKLVDKLKITTITISETKTCTKREMDQILSFGELLSTTLLAYRIKERGFESEWIDSRQLIKTDNNFGEASVNFEETEKLISYKIKPKKNKVFVAQGFIGSTNLEKNITTTLGRGGSDYSAAIFGAALNAEEIQIWTDVNGIMTTDPRIIKEAQTIKEITYDEAAELAFFGAKVVHPATIQPAIKKNIPVLVLNTKNAKGCFTTISNKKGKKGLKAIAGKKGITLVNINSSRMINAYGFLSRIFRIFEKYETPVDLISTSEVSVSLTIEDTTSLKKITKDLSEIGLISIEKEKSILCLVGQDLWRDPTFISRAFNRLANIPIRMISLGSSDTNLSCVVPQDKLNEAIKAIHKEFF